MIFDSFFFFMDCSLPTAASLFKLTGLKPSVVWLHLKSEKPPGMDLDHVFVCNVTVGCSGNDYNVSQRKHFVFMC